jgi:hypothetical protein
MGLSIVASFLDRTEAQIAAAALCSAGFGAVVMDTNFSGADWMATQALGGIRIGVPVGELDEAAQFLRELTSEKPEPGPDPHPGSWRTVALALFLGGPVLLFLFHDLTNWWQVALFLVGVVSWPLALIVMAVGKSRGRAGQGVAIASTALLIFGLLAGASALIALIYYLPQLLYPHGQR